MLPKSKRLSTETFKKIIEKGQSFHGPFLIIRAYKTAKQSHFGVSVPKKVSKLASSRNKIKRQLRMMIQECFHFDEEVDYIVIVRKNFLNHTYIENKKELEYLYKKVKRKEISK